MEDEEYIFCLEKINLLSKREIILGLDRIRTLLNFFNNPQDSLTNIHVAGTNGKGSVCAMINSVLNYSKTYKHKKIKVGLYTSPHLCCIRERIKINNTKITKSHFINLSKKIFKIIEKNTILITEFEFITCIAFIYFKQENVDVSIFETGLGGRLDATNVLKNPLVSVITEISYDHIQFLGNTLSEIAYEKSGIIKKNRCVVLSEQKSFLVRKIVKEKCKELNCNFFYAHKNVKLKSKKINKNIYLFTRKYEQFTYKKNIYSIPLFGEHQCENLASVLHALKIIKKYFKISKKSIKRGLKKTNLRARFEILCRNPLVILDGAHNEEGSKTLCKAIEFYLPDEIKKIAIFTAMKDKNIDKVLYNLKGKFSEIIVTNIENNSRCENITNLNKIASKYNTKVINAINPHKSLELLLIKKLPTIIFGSLFLAGEILKEISDLGIQK